MRINALKGKCGKCGVLGIDLVPGIMARPEESPAKGLILAGLLLALV